MAQNNWGSIYPVSWWGSVPNPNNWGEIYADYPVLFNEYAMNYDGVTPGESISVLDLPFQFIESQGTAFFAWVKLDPSIKTSFGNFSQRCIIDYSQDIYNSSNAKGYSVFLRKTSTLFQLSFFYHRIGKTRTECSATIDANRIDLTKPFLIAATTYPDTSVTPNLTRQFLYVFQEGISFTTNYLYAYEGEEYNLGISFPSAQNVCFGNTSDAGTVGSEFVGQIDEVAMYEAFDSNSAMPDKFVEFAEQYYYGRSSQAALDLNAVSLGSPFDVGYLSKARGWYRMGDGATYNGTIWELPNAFGNGIGGTASSDSSMTPANRVAGII